MKSQQSCESSADQIHIVRLAVKDSHRNERKDVGLPRHAVDSVVVNDHGCEGDYNRYRETKKGGRQQMALSLVTADVYRALRDEGDWPQVQEGDLGENMTLEGLGNGELAEGLCLRGTEGGVVFELTEEMNPCNELLRLPYVGLHNRDFLKTLQGRRGWYARVCQTGTLRSGELLERVTDAATTRTTTATTTAIATAPSPSKPAEEDAKQAPSKSSPSVAAAGQSAEITAASKAKSPSLTNMIFLSVEAWYSIAFLSILISCVIYSYGIPDSRQHD